MLTLPLASCSDDKDKEDTGTVGEADTDTDTDTDADADADTGDTGEPPPSCTASMTTSEPEDGTADWYWKTPLIIDFDSVPEESNIISLADSEGNAVDFSSEWADHGETVTITPSLSGSTAYTVSVSCLEEQSFSFETSHYGAPLEIAQEDLVGKTYELDLPGAYFKEPAGVGALLSTYLANPLLASPVAVDDAEITMLAAQGLWDTEGVPSQDMSMGTFPFPPSDWTGAPFFSGDTEEIIVTYDTTDIIIHNVHLEGTFAADGSSLGGAWASGLADTRNLYTLLDLPDMPGVEPEDVVCAYLESLGLPCIDCGDGVDRCLYMEAYFDDAPLVEGVTLDPDPTGSGR